MYSSNYHDRSEAQWRANNRTRGSAMLASISMLGLGLSLAATGSTMPAAAASTVQGAAASSNATPALETGSLNGGRSTARSYSEQPDTPDPADGDADAI